MNKNFKITGIILRIIAICICVYLTISMHEVYRSTIVLFNHYGKVKSSLEDQECFDYLPSPITGEIQEHFDLGIDNHHFIERVFVHQIIISCIICISIILQLLWVFFANKVKRA